MHVRGAMRTHLVLLVCSTLALLAIACGVGGKKDAAHAAINTMSVEERRETFEATLRILDEEPELVDELYATTRRHPKTFSRIMENATRDLREEEVAKLTAQLLARHPESVEQTLVRSTDEIAKSKESRAAMRRAIEKRSDKTVDILTDDADTLARLVAVSLAILEKKPAARKAMLLAVRRNRERLVEFVKDDPPLAKDLAEQFLRGVIDDTKEEKVKKR